MGCTLWLRDGDQARSDEGYGAILQLAGGSMYGPTIWSGSRLDSYKSGNHKILINGEMMKIG